MSEDRSFKIWDASQAAYMENFYGHKSTVLEVDILSKDYMISASFDKRPIIWKIPQESQLIFKERNYAIDCIKGVNPTHFVSGGQDGEVCLWTLSKVKPVYKMKECHKGGWIGALVSY